MILIAIKSIYIQLYVIYHPYCSITIAQVLALGPKDILVKNIWIVRGQLHWMSGTDGVFDCQSSGFIDQGKAWISLFVLHFCAQLLIFDPVLVWIGRIRTSENDLAITDGERVIRLGLGVNPNRGFMSSRIGDIVMSMVLNERGHMGAMVMGIVLTLVRDVLDCRARRIGRRRSSIIRFTSEVRGVRNMWWRRCVIEGRWWCWSVRFEGWWWWKLFFVPPVVVGAVVGVAERVIHFDGK